MELFFSIISYTKVDPGLMRHSPPLSSSRHTPLSPYANFGGIIACTFWPTTILLTISSKPGITDPDPILKSNALFFPSECVASKIYNIGKQEDVSISCSSKRKIWFIYNCKSILKKERYLYIRDDTYCFYSLDH